MVNRTLIKLALQLASSFILAILLVLLYVVNNFDISTQSVYQLSAQQKLTDYYLISYADGPAVYWQNRNFLVNSAVNCGFDVIINYRREHLAPDYITAHPILNESTGAGFWLWKPYLILKTLQRLPEHAVVVYADSGLFMRQPIREYFEPGLVTGKDILLFNYNPAYYGYAARSANRATFDALNCTSEQCRRGHHVWAGLIVVRNSPQSRKFIRQWLKYCEQADLLTGENSKVDNFPEFVFHQHDEGILSVLSARDAHVVNFLPLDKKFSKYIGIHRRKAATRSLLPYVVVDFSNVNDAW